VDEDVLDEEDVLLGGGRREDVDNSMMDTMFNLIAYVSGRNDEDDDDESDNELGGTSNGSDTSSQGWTYLTGSCRPKIFISIDGVDKRLLDRAREEVPAVLMNVKKKLGYRRDRDAHTLSPGDYLKAFMDPMFLGYMKAYINTHITNRNDIVSSSDIIAFIRIELMISFYKVSTALVDDRTCDYIMD
jgi:hypothetical protein